MPTDVTDRQQEFRPVFEQAQRARRERDAGEALQLFRQAVSLASTDGERAEALSMVGYCAGETGDFGSAETALAEALRLAAGSPEMLARVKLEAGVVRWQQGQLDGAKQFLSEAAAELRRSGDQTTRQRVLGNLGLVLHSRGEYQEAISTLKSVLELAENLGNWYLVAINLSNIGECYQDLGDLAKAREIHERALVVVREHGLGANAQIDALRNLGVDLLGMGRLDEAAGMIKQSLVLAQANHRQDLELQSMVSLGEVYLTQGECDKAEEVARQLIEASTGVPIRLAAARLLLGRCRLARNDALQAVSLLEAGLIDAQASYSKIWILRLHAALSQIVSQPAIAEVHRRIAAELVEQIADSLYDKPLRTVFLQSPLARSLK